MLPVLGVPQAIAADLPPGGTFLDDDGNGHEGMIEALVAEGVTAGCTDDLYCPADAVTRGQMAALLVRALDLPASETDHFDDDDGSLFEPAINSFADAGLTDGCTTPSRYCPDDAVTRGQMAAFLREAGDLQPSDVDHFSDDDGHLFEVDINAIAAAGVTTGCSPTDDTLYCPDAPTERDEMATFIGRLLDLTPTPPPPRPEPESEPEAEARSTQTPESYSPDDAIREWFPDRYSQARRVAECESGMNPQAVNPAGYHGLFQIGERYHRDRFEDVTGVRWSDGIYVAYYNAQYAKWLHAASGDSWSQWGCKP